MYLYIIKVDKTITSNKKYIEIGKIIKLGIYIKYIIYKHKNIIYNIHNNTILYIILHTHKQTSYV